MDSQIGLLIAIKATDSASGIISGIVDKLAGSNGLTKALAGVALGAAGLAIGLGVTSVKAAADFQTGITSLSTGAGELQSNLALVSQGILDLSTQTGTSTDQLISGMYMIESAGFHGAAGLDVLKASAEGAKVGNADLGTVANGVTTLMVDYASKHLTAAQATNQLIATVAAGKTHMQDLATALSTIAPTAAAVGVNVTDMNAAMATMTGEGTNAAAAATYLRQLLMALESPAKKGADALASIGLSSKQVSDEMKVSLPDTLQLITDHLSKKFPVGSAAYVDALKNIAGGSKQMQGILELTGSHLQTLKDNVNNITDAVNKGGKSITGFNQVQQDFGFKADQAKAALNVLGITVGTALLPVLTNLATDVTPLITHFQTWLEKSGALKDITGLVSGGIKELGVIIGELSSVLGDVFGWFDKNQWALYVIAGAATAFGVALASIKVLEFASGLQNMFTKLQQGDGIVSNLADKFLTKFLPNTKKAFFDKGGLQDAADTTKTKLQAVETELDTTSTKVTGIGDSATEAQGVVQGTLPGFEEDFAAVGADADTASTAVTGIGTEATKAEGVVAAESVAMETDLAGVGTAAETASGEEGIGKIGPSAVAAEGEVATQSGFMSKALAAVGGPLGIGVIVTALGTLGPAAYQAGVDMKKQMISQIDDMIQQAKAKKGAMEAALAYQASLQIDIQRAQLGLPSQQEEAAAPYDNTPPTLLKHHATGGIIPPHGLGIMGDTGGRPEIVAGGTSGLSVFSPAQTAAILNGGGATHLNFGAGSIVINAPGGNPGVISRQLMDAIEREMARRFRTQTSGFALAGVP